LFRNIYYDQKKSKMHLWHTVKGERLYDIYDWTPYLYIRDLDGNVDTIDGNKATKKTFNSYWDKRKYEKFKKSGIYENNVAPQIQYLTERYYGIPDDELEHPRLLIYTIDIEIDAEEFPSYKNPKYPITVISIHNNFNDKVYVFGLHDFTPDDKTVYFKCANDFELLKNMIHFIHENPPDIFTGWNIYNFDFPYIIERTRLLSGNDKLIEQLSPINLLRQWESTTGDYKLDIPGISIIDYLPTYKRYAYKNLENFRLDTVAKEELGEGKLDYSEYGSGAIGLRNLYQQNYQKYVEYNIIDVRRVDQIEKKRGFIQHNMLAVSLLTKVPLVFTESQTKMIEGALLTYFRRNNLCAPYHDEFQSSHPFTGAIVKDPLKGFYEYVIDLDITSSYPSHIITLNMSVETYYGRITDKTEEQIVKYTQLKEFPDFMFKSKSGNVKHFKDELLLKFNNAVKMKKFSIAPCGTIFVNDRKGVIADIQKTYFMKRKETKQKMFKLKHSLESIKDKKKIDIIKIKISILNSYQTALKALLNSTYGATSVPYSRYFNPDISLAITTCGVNTILRAQDYANDFMNDKIKNKQVSKIIDSLLKVSK